MARTVADLPTGLLGADIPDYRDHFKSVGGKPRPIDLTDHYQITIDHQGDNSCTGRAAKKFMEILWQKMGRSLIDFSALGLYYEARPFKNRDSGAQLREAALATIRAGAVPEYVWRGHESPVHLPDDYRDWDNDRRFRINTVERVQDAEVLKRVLSVERLPALSGIALQRYSTDAMLDSGWAPNYNPSDPVTGHHAELIVGWDLISGQEWVKFAGSWGVNVGLDGFYWRPMNYVTSGAVMDMWTAGEEMF